MARPQSIAAMSDIIEVWAGRLEVRDPVKPSRPGPSHAAIQKDGQFQCFWTFADATPLFTPSNFNQEGRRMGLCISVPPEVVQQARDFDAWACAYAAHHSERLFQKTLTLEQVTEKYCPLVKHADSRYPPNLRIKMQEGSTRSAVQYWTKNGEVRGPPSDWLRCKLQCRVLIKSFWIMSSQQWGVSVELVDALVDDKQASFPFKIL